MCIKKNDPFAALMTVAQDRQGYFTTKQAIEAGYAATSGISSACMRQTNSPAAAACGR